MAKNISLVSKHNKTYYEKNRDKLLEKRKITNPLLVMKLKEQIPCPKCACMISYRNLSRHMKSSACKEEKELKNNTLV
jgi:hypothetical protein